VLAPYEVEQTGHQDGAERWVVRVDECPVAVFAEHGIELTRVSLTGQRGQIVLNASPEVDTRELVELAEQEFAAVELTRRQTRSIQQQDRPALDSLADLTPRQREVLKTAYQSGFFESPRQMNTEDIASLLDISQPAVSRHLRNIQQTIFERVVDDISVSPAEETD
jgi:predicted DNA binding protein